MSLRAMNAVWMHSEAKGNDLLTLLAISDNANDDGFAFPSYPHLAAKTRLSRSTMLRCVSRLLEGDELSLVSRGTNGQANTYAVQVKTLLSKPHHLDKGSSKLLPPPSSSDSSNKSDPQPSGLQPSEKSTVADTTATTSETEHADTLFPQPAVVADDSKRELDEATQRIWQHYVTLFDPPRPELTPSRERQIEKVLKETESMSDRVEYLCKAITGLHTWRSKKPGDRGLSAVFQTRPGGSSLADQLQFFVDQAESGGTSASPRVPSVLAGTITARKREVIDMLAYPDSPDHKERGLAAMQWLKEHAHTEPIISVSGELQGWQAVAA